MLTLVAEVGRNFILAKCHQKRSIRIWKWKSVTNLENKKHGPVVYLSLPEKNKTNDISVREIMASKFHYQK